MPLEVVVEAGNPADGARFLPMLDRHITFYGEPPRQTAADGGIASHDNLEQAKARDVADVAFHKKSGLEIEAPKTGSYCRRETGARSGRRAKLAKATAKQEVLTS